MTFEDLTLAAKPECPSHSLRPRLLSRLAGGPALALIVMGQMMGLMIGLPASAQAQEAEQIINADETGTTDETSTADETRDTGETGTAGETSEPGTIGETDTSGGQTYEPAYFEHFSPRNALDMIRQIPGFTISGGNDNGQRGLGQANENVLVNGQRFSSKSEGVRGQLRRIPADDVVRIEIVDGTSLDLPGLSGQVANVITLSSGLSGQYRYNFGFRAHNTPAQLYGGEISMTGKSDALEYTVALKNGNHRFGVDGPIILADSNGDLIERQETQFNGGFDSPTLSTNFTYDFGDKIIGNLNLSYAEDFFYRDTVETAFPATGPIRSRLDNVSGDGPEYEIGGDITFPLGSGSLKLIGLERFEGDNFNSQVTDDYDDNTVSTGSRFQQNNQAGERIGRFEYSWKMAGGDWQLSGEAAYNRLKRVSHLFDLDANGQFIEEDFPEGTGGVTEDRYEAGLSYGTPLSDKLSLQATIAGEFSKIEQTGAEANSRKFRRPKGSLSLAWKPEKTLNFSLELRRSVGQLSFGDFLASVSLNDDNQNAGNRDLVPHQSWNLDMEANKNLGAWGSLKLNVNQSWFEDFIDFFPLSDGSEARGNIGNARRTQLEVNATIKGEPIGWNGAKLDVKGIKRWMRQSDPFTGENRPFSNDLVDLLEVDFRQDIKGSDWAYGAGMFTNHGSGYSRLTETGIYSEGPTFLTIFVEHKDVMGLNVKARIGNVLGATENFNRVVYEDSRPNAAIDFTETSRRRIGPIFRFTISGNF